MRIIILFCLVAVASLPSASALDADDNFFPEVLGRDGKIVIEVQFLPMEGPNGAVLVTNADDPFGDYYLARLTASGKPFKSFKAKRTGPKGHQKGSIDLVDGDKVLGNLKPVQFERVTVQNLGARFAAGAAANQTVTPSFIPVSNDGDSLAVSPDGRYTVVVGANGPAVSLVDGVTGQEVDTFAGGGQEGITAAICEDNQTVLAIIGPKVHRLTITPAGKLMDTGEAFSLPAGSTFFLRVLAVPGLKVGLVQARSNAHGPTLITFSIPGMLPLDSVEQSATGELDGVAVAADGTKVFARSGYPTGQIEGFTLNPVTGVLGHTPFLTIANVSPAFLTTSYRNALDLTPDGAHVLASESASTPTATVPTPRVTSFNAATGARESFFEPPSAPSFTDLLEITDIHATSMVLFGKGTPAPGASAVAGHPPADALLASFGVPAIDVGDKVAFTAKWTSASAGKGSGLFTGTSSVAIVGGAAPGLAGPTFAAFTDPVIDTGHVAFRATLGGVPKNAAGVVVSDAANGALEIVARQGDLAPGAEGAKFKSFTEVGLNGASVGFLAKLDGPATSDLSLWAKDATHSLTLLLREKKMIGARTIKTIASFKVGNGSPGQGRGWVQGGGTTQVLALVTFYDTTQAIVAAGIDGMATVLSQSGPGGVGGPDVTGATFKSYGVPTLNAQGGAAFLGTLTKDTGDATSHNAQGVFADFGTLLAKPIARLEGDAGETGGKFSSFRDPVLASDGALAFGATLKGGGARGVTAASLWKQGAGGTLTLAARGGMTPPGTQTGVQWKAFTSYAILAGRGPLLAASLVVGKGGVKSSTASGVWGPDATGELQLLFRTGQTVGDLKLKSFSALQAVAGSVGATRSFNDAGKVIWRATFTNKETAIVLTTPP